MKKSSAPKHMHDTKSSGVSLPSTMPLSTAAAILSVNDKFRFSICSFVAFAENEHRPMLTCTYICQTFQFQRRRLYDVINALEAVGCCKKMTVDTIIWKGIRNIPESLRETFFSYALNKDETDIDVLISQQDNSISIMHLTQAMVMLFIALQKQQLEIKKIAQFLSKINRRFKTTLCKLYQIAHILEALGILSKSSTPGILVLNKPYYAVYSNSSDKNNNNGNSEEEEMSYDSEIETDIGNPLSISSLLNRPNNLLALNAREKRNRDFEKAQIPLEDINEMLIAESGLIEIENTV